MSILNKSPFTSSGLLGFGFQELPGFGNVRTAEFRDYNNDGIDDRDQGINIPNPNVTEYFPGFGNSISIGGPDGPRVIPGPGDGPGMSPPPVRSEQPMQQMPVANSFLEQLQQSTGLLGQQIRNTQPFATYTPTATDFVRGVAQNRFVGNQFQMPTLGLQSGEGIPVFGGTYTPLPFGSAYDISQSNDLTPIETLLNAVSDERGGPGGLDAQRKAFGMLDDLGNTVGYENLGQLMTDVKSGFGLFGNPLTDPSYSIAGPAVISSYQPRIPGLLGNLIEGIRNFAGKGNDDTDDTTSKGIGGFTKQDETRESFRGGGTGASTGDKIGDRAAAGQRGEKAGPKGKGQYGGR